MNKKLVKLILLGFGRIKMKPLSENGHFSQQNIWLIMAVCASEQLNVLLLNLIC